MLYIAKMGTNYPDYHGKGFYNFLMSPTAEGIESQIRANSHDFHHIKTIVTRFKSVDALIRAYPTSSDLNKARFNG